MATRTIEEIENILACYTLTEIFEMNQLEEVDVLFFLVEEEFLELPTPKPLWTILRIELSGSQ